MGVKGFLYMIKKVYKYSLTSFQKTDILVIDGNCIFHDIIANYLHILTPCIDDIVNDILEKFGNIIKTHGSKFTYVCIDGVPPLPKQYCQKQRRKENFSLSAFLLPGTRLMEILEESLVNTFQNDTVCIQTSKRIGEGEQKMINILKKYRSDSVTLLSFDSDVIILCLLQMKPRLQTTTIVEIPTFDMFIDINDLYRRFENDNLIDRLLWICVLCGNDFFPTFRSFKEMTTTEIFNRFKKQKLISSFEDLYVSDVCSCDDEDGDNYVTLWNWYREYFMSNAFITTDPYVSDESPCITCILKYLLNGKIYEFEKTTVEKNHLSYVLSKNHHLCV